MFYHNNDTPCVSSSPFCQDIMILSISSSRPRCVPEGELDIVFVVPLLQLQDARSRGSRPEPMDRISLLRRRCFRVGACGVRNQSQIEGRRQEDEVKARRSPALQVTDFVRLRSD